MVFKGIPCKTYLWWIKYADEHTHGVWLNFGGNINAISLEEFVQRRVILPRSIRQHARARIFALVGVVVFG